jgi:hypothetical protein
MIHSHVCSMFGSMFETIPIVYCIKINEVQKVKSKHVSPGGW